MLESGNDFLTRRTKSNTIHESIKLNGDLQ